MAEWTPPLVPWLFDVVILKCYLLVQPNFFGGVVDRQTFTISLSLHVVVGSESTSMACLWHHRACDRGRLQLHHLIRLEMLLVRVGRDMVAHGLRFGGEQSRVVMIPTIGENTSDHPSFQLYIKKSEDRWAGPTIGAFRTLYCHSPQLVLFHLEGCKPDSPLCYTSGRLPQSYFWVLVSTMKFQPSPMAPFTYWNFLGYQTKVLICPIVLSMTPSKFNLYKENRSLRNVTLWVQSYLLHNPPFGWAPCFHPCNV